MVVSLIEALEGGCSKTQLKTNTFNQRIIHPKSSHNNCFFKCIQPYVPFIRERITKSNCNTIRAQFQLAPDTKIDVQTALRIFQHYREGTNGLKLWTNDTLLGQVEGNPVLNLSLENEHYALLKVKQYQIVEEPIYPSTHAMLIDKFINKSKRARIAL